MGCAHGCSSRGGQACSGQHFKAGQGASRPTSQGMGPLAPKKGPYLTHKGKNKALSHPEARVEC